MAIAFDKYVDITSAVGGSGAARYKEMIGRIFTESDPMPMNTVMEFTDADSVAEYFGSGTQEHKRALFYFSFIGKQITSPNKISFYRWTSVDTAPKIFGGKTKATAADFTSIPSGSFELEINGTTNIIGGLDFTGVTNMNDVAAVIQSAINAFSGTMWSAATVTFDAVNSRFNFVGGDILDQPITTISIIGTSFPQHLLHMLGWLGNGNTIFTPSLPRFVNGAQSNFPSNALSESVNASNNFASFLFMSAMSEQERLDLITQNASYNNDFMYCVSIGEADLYPFDPAFNGIGGWTATAARGDIPAVVNEYHEMMPMVILAATDYNRVDASQNYMYQQADLTPVVTETTLSDYLDDARVNYYGATQQAGRLVAFYQRGYMFGSDNDPRDQNTYANEIWLKDRIGVDLLNLMLSLGKISANRQGRAVVLSAVTAAVQVALFNGVISIGKLLTQTQKQFITSLTGNSDAWRQVQDSGYWLDCVIEQMVNGDFKARYILVYSKDDVVRKIEGSHVLI